jgi:hypothetical protein
MLYQCMEAKEVENRKKKKKKKFMNHEYPFTYSSDESEIIFASMLVKSEKLSESGVLSGKHIIAHKLATDIIQVAVVKNQKNKIKIKITHNSNKNIHSFMSEININVLTL